MEQDKIVDDRALPENSECSQCCHFRWCEEMRGVARTNTTCIESPSLFGVAVPVADVLAEIDARQKCSAKPSMSTR